MAETLSTMKLVIGAEVPLYTLPSVNGHGEVDLGADFSVGTTTGGPVGGVIIFMCNHCPFVRHIANEVSKLAKEYSARGIKFYGISSNDVATHPQDGPEAMAQEASERDYTFPYLYDESQEVAKSYFAACTPDFFVCDSQRKLVYRGRLDDSSPGRKDIVVDGKYLRQALARLLAGEAPLSEQLPSLGCNIKWKAGNAS